ncbi:unnamed protein product [Caenorhabditis angaria]|uniref:NFACT RNA-binding domain-containing protein n=1 Tax=Caenorhabditis angaria TaxID=860376 RepID=A0A9P1IKB4_9PELO|nr:unnamed protein product [Caenorhabditis angaria]
MKNRFTLVDVIAAVSELKNLIGMRVNNVYDIDNKTYLLKLSRTDEKAVILFESGVKLHQTFHDRPKSQTPSSFSMKLRKHINQKRLTDIKVIGFDRLVELTFGSEDRINKLIIELYDRGNVILTDGDYTILNILRVRTDKDTSVKFAVKEKYTYSASNLSQENIQNQKENSINEQDFDEILGRIPEGKTEQLVKIIAPLTKCGNPVTKEILARCGLKADLRVERNSETEKEIRSKLSEIQKITTEIWNQVENRPLGQITYTEEKSIANGTICEVYQDFNPILINNLPNAQKFKEFPTFCEAVDEFFVRIETQKLEQKSLNIEKQALKKLENVEKDQKERIDALVLAQEQREKMADRIIVNNDLVERALLLIRTALANQFSWVTIEEMRKKAAANGDPTASAILELKFENNEFIMGLGDPYDEDEEILKVPIDIALNAAKNAQKYFVDKKSAAEKVKKTVASSGKAIKNAQEKAKITLDHVKIVQEVKKTRKIMWFEKFRWFISSEGYIVVAGREAQQNELLVKKYLRAGDIYMHADVRGASSVIIRNHKSTSEIPPKTLTEAAQMAVCYSNAWEANISASAWWVHHHQVSRTAPTGEYLPAGSFMIRGKKNFMPPSQLVMGLGVLFRMDDESIERHREAEKTIEEESVKIEESPEKLEEEEEEFPDVEIKIGEEEELTMIEVGPKVVAGQNKNQQNQQKNPKKETAQYLEEKANEELANLGAPHLQPHEYAQYKKKKYRHQQGHRQWELQLICAIIFLLFYFL